MKKLAKRHRYKGKQSALDSSRALACKLRDYQLQLYFRLLCAALAAQV